MHKILAMSTFDDSASRYVDNGSQGSKLTAYLDLFDVKRGYIRPGQSIQVQYALPEGAQLDLYIRRCRSAFIIEIFNCQVVSERTAQVVNDKVGTRQFIFQDEGFYLFDEQVTLTSTQSPKYRVIWSRT